MWNLKYDSNEPLYETETDSHTEQTCGCPDGGVAGEEWTGSLELVDAN